MNKDKDLFRSIIYFTMILLCAAGLVGGIGGTAVTLYHGNGYAAVPLAGLLVTAFMVWPVIKELARRM